MDFKKIKTDSVAVTRNTNKLMEPTGNIYESVAVMSKRANQIALEIKEELNSKISEFAIPSDNLEEVFENREQIEIAKYYEHLPKPTLIAVQEFLNGQVYFRNPLKDQEEE
ncbi:MAG: DNA-directed RNA polymerase subunit omega [Bacteroidales bacterium]|jgi:DNA-directed RNA polymerase subunit K/omega|nr:DNA-directed RNA polymerase subunit omega [Bacteroidales bacterium]